MLTMQDGALIALRSGRSIQIARINDNDRYRALLAFQVRPSVAVALIRGLITIKGATP